jgi:hypothetical protein
MPLIDVVCKAMFVPLTVPSAYMKSEVECFGMAEQEMACRGVHKGLRVESD